MPYFICPRSLCSRWMRFIRILRIQAYKYGIADPFDYTLVKLHVDHGMILRATFLKVDGWDTLDEPLLDRAITIFPKILERHAEIRYYTGDNRPVYHHKWTMVDPGTPGSTTRHRRKGLHNGRPIQKLLR